MALRDGAARIKHSILRFCYLNAWDIGNDIEVGVYFSKAPGGAAHGDPAKLSPS